MRSAEASPRCTLLYASVNALAGGMSCEKMAMKAMNTLGSSVASALNTSRPPKYMTMTNTTAPRNSDKGELRSRFR